MNIYHKLEIIDNQEQIVLYVDYPDEYEFGLDFDVIKKNVLSVTDKIRDYAIKYINKISDNTVLLILNGVVVGTLAVTQLLNNGGTMQNPAKEIPTEIVSTIKETEFSKQIHNVPNLLENKFEFEKSEEPVKTNRAIVTNVSNNTTKSSNTTKQNELLISLKLNTGKIINIGLEDYVAGVVGSEMPADFHKEALKAQAVAARTYALKRISAGKTLTATTSDQVYKTESELKTLWGNSFNTYYTKVKQAVNETSGQYILHNGQYIDALYFSTSNGKTEDPKYIWGSSHPYLKSVNSPWDVGVRNYYGTKTIPMSTINSKLNVNLSSLSQIKINSRTSGNRVNSITIAGKTFTGNDVRMRLGLKSTDFDVSISGNSIVFTTKGYGHGVGMSQFGANGMAKEGKNHRQILSHYYTGITIAKK